MIMIRSLKTSEFPEAMELKVNSWTEELAGRANNKLSLNTEIIFWSHWVDLGKQCNDFRIFLGAFEYDELLGIAACSLADYKDIEEDGMELNLLAVKPEHRGRGVSLSLILYVLDYYQMFGAKKIVIYTHHYAPSNTYYAKFGAKLIRKEWQENGKIEVDVFMADIKSFKENLEKTLLNKYR